MNDSVEEGQVESMPLKQNNYILPVYKQAKPNTYENSAKIEKHIEMYSLLENCSGLFCPDLGLVLPVVEEFLDS